MKDETLSRTPSKSKGKDGRREIIVYMYQLSPLRRNKQNMMDYSTMVLQTSNKCTQETLVYLKVNNHKPQ